MYTGSDSPHFGVPKPRIFLWSGGIVCLAGILIFFVLDPTKIPIFPQCLFHQITGLDCPGCGAQRALHQLLHGNFIAAVRLNAMFVLSLPLAAWFVPRLILRWAKGTPLPQFNTRWLWVYLSAWIIFGIARNLPFPVCQWFAA